MVSFAVRKPIGLLGSYLLTGAYVSFAWEPKTLLRFMSEDISPMFSSRRSVVSRLKVFKPFCVFFCVWCEGMV